MGNLTSKTDKLHGKGLFVYAIKTNDKIKKLPGGEKIISTKYIFQDKRRSDVLFTKISGKKAAKYREIALDVGTDKPFTFIHISDTHLARANMNDGLAQG
ncbi:MAG: hypothetical protein II931_06915 [Clostridia bacterium]|nr:hypothetical protein [Clostridia bacterium]